ncbi:hypothetical protein POM88_010440 [Heracleum sosnowskyi]|uniref:Uncharacterized protein n=1 Tax=Heracleum sosnowskyi TaxID=360622 RepID=A0AAD8MZX9_9APIA|nr:hypothetical protein POM88_010440 [Heracleum sosnowskyi]
MAGQRNDIREMEEGFARFSIEDEERRGLNYSDVSEALGEIDTRWFLVGKFLTDSSIDFQAMRHKMASLWRPVTISENQGVRQVTQTDSQKLAISQENKSIDIEKNIDNNELFYMDPKRRRVDHEVIGPDEIMTNSPQTEIMNDVVHEEQQNQKNVQMAGLQDIELYGHPFTWERGRDTETWLEIRLDRAMATVKWFELFPYAKLYNLEGSPSDHNAIFLDPIRRVPGIQLITSSCFKDWLKWLEQQDAAGTDNLMQRLGCGAKVKENKLFDVELESDEDDERSSDDEEDVGPAKAARINAK